MKFILLVFLTSPAFCQDTWGGLRFGMTQGQARVALKDRPNSSRTEPAHAEFHTPEMFFIDVQDVMAGQHKGVAYVGFDKDLKLDKVTLNFSVSKNEPGCFSGISAEEVATRSMTLTDTSEKMLERYGAPVSESGTFPTSRELTSYYSLGQSGVAIKILEGQRIWRTEGQVIDEIFTLPCGNLFLFMSYKPPPKDDISALPTASGQTLNDPGGWQNVGPLTEGPSLKDTLDWLKEKIPLGAVNYVTSVDEPAVPSAVGRKQRSSVAPATTLVSSNEHAVVFSLDSCTGVFDRVTTITIGQQQGVNTIRYTVPLGVVTEAFVDHPENRGTFVSGDRSAYRLVLKSKSSYISVADFGINSQLPVTATTNWFYIKFNDESLANRVMTAFKHAADLCGKKEVF